MRRIPCGHNLSSACGPWWCCLRRTCPLCGLQRSEHNPDDCQWRRLKLALAAEGVR